MGGIVGYGRNPHNCMNYSNISIESDSVIMCGGIVGMPGAVYGKVVNSKNYGKIRTIANSSFDYCGGISGKEGAISYCFNYGDVYGETTKYQLANSFAGNCNVGGIVGATSGEVDYSVNYGNIESYSHEGGSSYGGGIAGFNGYYSSGVIRNSVNLGSSMKSTRQEKENGTYVNKKAPVGRIAAVSYTTSDSYSLANTLCNGEIPVDNLGSSQINGENISKEEAEAMIETWQVEN